MPACLLQLPPRQTLRVDLLQHNRTTASRSRARILLQRASKCLCSDDHDPCTGSLRHALLCRSWWVNDPRPLASANIQLTLRGHLHGLISLWLPFSEASSRHIQHMSLLSSACSHTAAVQGSTQPSGPSACCQVSAASHPAGCTSGLAAPLSQQLTGLEAGLVSSCSHAPFELFLPALGHAQALKRLRKCMHHK